MVINFVELDTILTQEKEELLKVILDSYSDTFWNSSENMKILNQHLMKKLWAFSREYMILKNKGKKICS